MNCFPECKYNYYFNETGDYICTKNLSCPSAYPFLLENTTECIESCTDTYKYQFRQRSSSKSRRTRRRKK